MKKIVMSLIPVFCFGLFAVMGCAPEAPKTKPADKPAAEKPADAKPAEAAKK